MVTDGLVCIYRCDFRNTLAKEIIILPMIADITFCEINLDINHCRFKLMWQTYHFVICILI